MNFTTFVSMIHICNGNSGCQCFPISRKWWDKWGILDPNFLDLESFVKLSVFVLGKLVPWRCFPAVTIHDMNGWLMQVSIHYFFGLWPRNQKTQHVEAFDQGDVVIQWQWVNHGIDIVQTPRSRWKIEVGKHCHTNNKLFSQLFSTFATL